MKSMIEAEVIEAARQVAIATEMARRYGELVTEWDRKAKQWAKVLELKRAIERDLCK